MSYLVKSKHTIMSGLEVPKIFRISEDKLCDKFDERFEDHSDLPHDMLEVDNCYPVKDAVELAMEDEHRDVAVHRIKNGVKVYFLEEKEVDLI